MQRGKDFLKAQVNNAVMLHKTLLENLEDHAKQADDAKYRALCEKYVANATARQAEVESYANSIGAEGPGSVKKAIGTVLGKARDTVDAMRETDFLRLVGDIVTIRQTQDTFATFAAAGDRLGDPRLAELGRTLERAHDEMQRDFNQLVHRLFIEHVQNVGAAATTESRPEAR